MLAAYDEACAGCCEHQPLDAGVMLATVCLSVYLYIVIPKGFFPQQDTGSSERRDSGRAGHFVRRDDAEADAVHARS